MTNVKTPTNVETFQHFVVDFNFCRFDKSLVTQTVQTVTGIAQWLNIKFAIAMNPS